MTTENYTDVTVFFDTFFNGEAIEYYAARGYPFAPIKVWHSATFIGKWSIDQAIIKMKYKNDPIIAHHSNIRKLT